MPTTTTYIIIYMLAGLTLLSLALWFVIKRRRQAAFERLVSEQTGPIEAENCEWPRLSIVIVSQEHAVALKNSLPSLLDQQYPNYEVVVVDAASTDDTPEVVKRLSERHENLRRTFVSPDSQIADLPRFALMLGLRAARADWVVVTAPGCYPDSKEWLMRMARHISSDTDLIIGTSIGEDALNYCIRKSAFEANGHTLEGIEKHFRTCHEWSPQACIYQRE